MTTTWTQLIEQQPSSIDDATTADGTSQLMPLSQLGVLHVTGEDAKGLLQNLVTNNVNALTINQGQLAGLCNPKGRLLAVFLIINRQDGFYLVLPQSMCAGLMQRLNMYKLRSKVTIDDVSQTQVCLGLLSNNEVNLPSISQPANVFDVVDVNDGFVIKLPSTQGSRYLFIGNSDQATLLADEVLNTEWQLSSDAYWQLSDIESGLAMIYPETKEAFTTQQVNLDLVDGVSFNKGCYPGQEIVARLHYLGSPSRRMFVAQMANDEALENGQDVLTEDGAVAGQLVRWVNSDPQTITMLLSLKLSDYQSALFLNSKAVNLITQDIPA